MTDRIKALTVILDHDYRDDDVDKLIKAIEFFHSVLKVEKNVATTDDHINRERIKQELREEIASILL